MRNPGPKIWLVKSGRSNSWVIRYIDLETGRVLQKSTGTDRKKDAERMLGELRADLLASRYQGPETTSWEVFREKYRMEVLSGLARTTRLKSETILDSVEKILKPKMLTDLTASQISKFVANLRDGKRSESTIAGYLAHLRSALSWAVSVGLIHRLPNIQKPKRAKINRKPKGRAPTEEEYKRILAAVPSIVGDERAPSWIHFIEGLWWSGLRLSEALELYWDRDDKLRIDRQGERMILRIPAELEKGHQDRLLPIAPEFEKFLTAVPREKQTGRVFNPRANRVHGEGLQMLRVSKVIGMIGKESGIVVNVDIRTGKTKYVSAHDLRRAFGDRWALRVMPPVLMQLMRHESIDTTMRFYVGRRVQATADVIWDAYKSVKKQEDDKKGSHVTLYVTPAKKRMKREKFNLTQNVI